jgi:simple sugar transport system permease protein
VHNVLATVFVSADFWDSMIRVTGPIAFAALACVLAARAGILFIGVEGVMLISAFFAIATAAWTGSIWAGVGTAVVSGMLGALLFGFLSIVLRMGDVVGGLVIYVGSLGLTAFLAAELFPFGATIGSQALEPLWSPVGGWAGVFLDQQPLVYVAILAAIAITLFLRTRFGLMVRASGESLRVARGFGIKLVRLRFLVLAVSGALTGLGGATIGLAIVGTFDTNVVGGRGFIGLVCVVLGAWRPLPVLLASAAFGTAYVIPFRVDVFGDWIQLLPYVAALVAVGLFWRHTQGPPEEGRGLPEEAR